MRIITLVSGNVDDGGEETEEPERVEEKGKDSDTFQILGRATPQFLDSHPNRFPILTLGNGAKSGHSGKAHHSIQERHLAHGFISQG